ncbi:MAG TPA: KpsF/GutQ family sugar-phosphate isomerase [Burkholderiaceae bacterium]|nr:KpsF/GutQ family sugar-phosphate isomerase [Burkholderiaceae bacterium]
MNPVDHVKLPGAAAQSRSSALALARDVLTTESQAVAALVDRLDERFLRAVELVLGCRGRVVVSGVGKSGHIARKIAATLASTGTPALFVHAAEAAHGDLGMVTGRDVFIAMSYSGETDELLTIVPILKRGGTPLIALTGHANSSLAGYADVHLDCRVEREACPLNLSPTSSTTAMLALGDALAIACLDARGFGADDFARSHPGGALGRRLLTRVSDVMHTGEAIPVVSADDTVMDALREISSKRLGMTAVRNLDGTLAGIFTDGDLRRLLEGGGDARATRVRDVMTTAPLTIAPQALAVEAAQLLDSGRKNQLLVVDAEHRLVGALHMHDLMAARVI